MWPLCIFEWWRPKFQNPLTLHEYRRALYAALLLFWQRLWQPLDSSPPWWGDMIVSQTWHRDRWHRHGTETYIYIYILDSHMAPYSACEVAQSAARSNAQFEAERFWTWFRSYLGFSRFSRVFSVFSSFLGFVEFSGFSWVFLSNTVDLVRNTMDWRYLSKSMDLQSTK